MKIISLKLLAVISCIFFLSINVVLAGDPPDTTPDPLTAPPVSSNVAGDQMSAFRGSAGLYYTMSAENVVANIIQTALSLLGVIFLILMIYSGYQWMTAGGNQETVKTAQGRIKNAIIGVAIVALAYAITAFVFRALPGGGSSGGGNNDSGFEVN